MQDLRPCHRFTLLALHFQKIPRCGIHRNLRSPALELQSPLHQKAKRERGKEWIKSILCFKSQPTNDRSLPIPFHWWDLVTWPQLDTRHSGKCSSWLAATIPHYGMGKIDFGGQTDISDVHTSSMNRWPNGKDYFESKYQGLHQATHHMYMQRRNNQGSIKAELMMVRVSKV